MSWDPAATCVALNADEPLMGSAPHNRIWVAVDCPKPWTPKVQNSSQFPAAAGAALESLLARGDSLGLLGRTAQGHGLTVYRYTEGAFGEVAIRLTDQERLDSLAHADWDAFDWSPAQPVLYVCTHGSRDSCCGRLGVQLAQSLRDHAAGRIYESSHLGGHRFAPTLLALPSGRLYGRIPIERAADLCACLENDDLGQLEWLRGHSAHSSPLQILEAELARRLGYFPENLAKLSENEGVIEFAAGPLQGRAVFSKSWRSVPQSCSDVPKGTAKQTALWSLRELTL